MASYYIVRAGTNIVKSEQINNKSVTSSCTTNRPMTFRHYELIEFLSETNQYHFLFNKTHFYVDKEKVLLIK